MSTTQDTDTRHTLARNFGTPRPAGRIQPGWWVHLKATDEGVAARAADSWEQVDCVMEAAGILVLNFTGGTHIAAGKKQEAMTLTEREARKHGLVASADLAADVLSVADEGHSGGMAPPAPALAASSSGRGAA